MVKKTRIHTLYGVVDDNSDDDFFKECMYKMGIDIAKKLVDKNIVAIVDVNNPGKNYVLKNYSMGCYVEKRKGEKNGRNN